MLRASPPLLLAVTPRLGGQTVRYGVVTDSVRALLGRSWNEDSTQVERGFCLRHVRISVHRISRTAVDSIFRVLAIVPATVRGADPNHVDFECVAGTPELHTHTPATCLSDNPRFCVADGPLAYSCQPSREDYEKLIRRRDPFGIVQCDRKAFRFYYPSEFTPDVEEVPAAAKPPP